MNRLLSIAIVAALVCAMHAVAFADGMIVPTEPLAPRIADHFAVEYHIVTVDIDNQHATTHVDQKIRNEAGQLAQAQYMFPVPKNAAISNFSMMMGEQNVHGEMMTAEEAKRIYEDFVRRTIDPALLEYVSQGLWKTSVFPFQADEAKRIQLEYNELLTADNGLVRYLYPLNTEKFSKYPLERCRVEIMITAAKPITNVYSPSHDMQMTRIDDTRVQLVWEVNGETPTTDLEIYYSVEEGDIGANLLSYMPAGSQYGYFVYLAAPNPVVDEAPTPKDIVFVVDSSGSMQEDRKMIQAREALEFCVKSLNPEDRFSVVSFSDRLNVLSEELLANNETNVADAVAFVKRLRAEGGTNINDAALKALGMFDAESGNTPFVIFLTDGKATIGERNEVKIAENIRTANATGTNARFFTFGVGYDVNTILLDWIATQNRALAEYVLPSENLEATVSGFYNKIKSPVMTDIKLHVDGVRVESLHPALLSDIFAGTQSVIVGRYVAGGHATVTLAGQLRGRDHAIEMGVDFAVSEGGQDDSKAWIEFLWASRQIAHLIDNIRLSGESDELIDGVAELSKRYGIPTMYTSYLVMEDVDLQDQDGLNRRARENFGGAMEDAAGGASGFNQARGNQALGRAERAPGQAGEQRGWHDEKGDYQETSNVTNIGRRTFYWRESQWQDLQSIETTEEEDVETRDIAMFSDDFFAALEEAPELYKYVAQGRSIRVRLGQVVYNFTPAASDDEGEGESEDGSEDSEG